MKLDKATDEFFQELKCTLMPNFSKVGPYQILHEVAHGGQGVVYQARDIRDDSLVAIKRSYESSGDTYKKLMRGTELAATLDHPYVLPITSIETQSDTIWIATPWIDGKTANVWAMERGRKTEDVIKVFIGICSAVSHAHFRGVIHRDLRPSNILIREDGSPCILDFGIAKRASFSDEISNSSKTFLAGNIRYLPPEVLNQTDSSPDIRQDVYSLGVLLYEMLTGMHPMDGQTPSDCIKQVASGRLFDTKIDKTLVGSLGPIIRKATSVELGARYSTALELVGDIKDDQQGLPVQALAHTRMYLLSRYVRRNRTPIAACVVLFLGAMLGWSYTDGVARTESDLRVSNSQTLGVLTDFIQALGPAKELGPNMDSVDVLKLVSDEVWRMEFSGDEGIAVAIAGLHESLGNSFLQIRREDLGIQHVRESYEIYTRFFGLEDQRTQRSGAQLAHHLIGTHEPVLAESLTRTLVGDAAPNDIRLEHHLLNLSVSLIRQQRMSEVRPYLDEYLTRFEKDTAEYATGLESSVIYYNVLGQARLGLRDADEMYLVNNTLFGAEDARTLSAQLFQIKSLQLLGEFHKERELVLAVLPLISRAFGESDPRYFRAMAHLATSEIELGYGEDALSRARHLLSINTQRSSVNSWGSTQSRFLVSYALLETGKPEQVLEMMIPEVERVFSMMRSRPIARHRPRYLAARAYNDLGQFNAALAILKPAIEDLRESLSSNHQQLLLFEYELIKASATTMPVQELRDSIQQLAARYGEGFGPNHPYTTRILIHSKAATNEELVRPPTSFSQ